MRGLWAVLESISSVSRQKMRLRASSGSSSEGIVIVS